jgi:hypothetical protein
MSIGLASFSQKMKFFVGGAENRPQSENVERKRRWRGTELNRRRRDFQSLALPTELPRHKRNSKIGLSIKRLASKVNI